MPLDSRSIAFVLFGGNAGEEVGGRQNIADFVVWAHDTGARCRRNGVRRLHLQNPGGLFFNVDPLDPREMRIDQWLLAERTGQIYSQRDRLRLAIGILNYYQVEPIVYLGSPTQLDSPERDLHRCVNPFIWPGLRLSFAFDAIFEDTDWSATWSPRGPYVSALKKLRRRGYKIYAEPRLTAAKIDAGLGKLVDGTIAQSSYDANPSFAVNLDIQPGETIRTTATGNHTDAWPEIAAWPTIITPLLRHELNWGPLSTL